MAKSPHNFIGLHKEYGEVMDILCEILEPEYEENNDDYLDRLVDTLSITSALANKLEDAEKNVKTINIMESYRKEKEEIQFWNNEIKDKLKDK